MTITSIMSLPVLSLIRFSSWGIGWLGLWSRHYILVYLWATRPWALWLPPSSELDLQRLQWSFCRDQDHSCACLRKTSMNQCFSLYPTCMRFFSARVLTALCSFMFFVLSIHSYHNKALDKVDCVRWSRKSLKLRSALVHQVCVPMLILIHPQLNSSEWIKLVEWSFGGLVNQISIGTSLPGEIFFIISKIVLKCSDCYMCDQFSMVWYWYYIIHTFTRTAMIESQENKSNIYVKKKEKVNLVVILLCWLVMFT